MKRLAVLQPSRRDVCTGVLGCAFGLWIAGCTGNNDVVQTGGIGPEGDDDDQQAPDARSIDARGFDASVNVDAGMTGGTCTTGVLDVGAPTMFASGAPVLISSASAFVVRDAGGLYALSSRCTHNNVTLNVSSGRFRCPRHGALFTFDGAIISGPVSRTLVHYSLCVMTNGHVGLDRNTVVANTVRLTA
ncbi:MAG TPA: Rieske (2Fe-2S) protein [Kofleriaceae bacterium]|nr:Rieske (2Fe-2S) protein [Kofleriaceae bacterium]